MTHLPSSKVSNLPFVLLGIMILVCGCPQQKQEEPATPPAPAAQAAPPEMVPEDAEPQYKKGQMYLRGVGVTQDLKQAVEWFMKAAINGHAKAQYNLGAMYGWGSGVAPDMAQANQWLEKAAAKGVVEAYVNLGIVYANGYGVEKDMNEATLWFQMAADKGDEDARTILDQLKKDDKYVPACPSLPKAKLCGPIEE